MCVCVLPHHSLCWGFTSGVNIFTNEFPYNVQLMSEPVGSLCFVFVHLFAPSWPHCKVRKGRQVLKSIVEASMRPLDSALAEFKEQVASGSSESEKRKLAFLADEGVSSKVSSVLSNLLPEYWDSLCKVEDTKTGWEMANEHGMGRVNPYIENHFGSNDISKICWG